MHWQALRKIDPDIHSEECDRIVLAVFDRQDSLPNAEFSARLRLVRTERATDRSDSRVQRALRPKSDLLLLAEKKVRQVMPV